MQGACALGRSSPEVAELGENLGIGDLGMDVLGGDLGSGSPGIVVVEKGDLDSWGSGGVSKGAVVVQEASPLFTGHLRSACWWLTGACRMSTVPLYA